MAIHFAAQREVAHWTKKIQKGVQFSGYRSSHFNTILAIITERIKKLKEKLVLLSRPGGLGQDRTTRAEREQGAHRCWEPQRAHD